MTRILIGDSHRVSKWTGQNPMQVFMLSALLGSSLAWNLGAGFVLWTMIHCSAHMLPPNPSSVAWQPLQKYTMKQLLKERRKHKPCRHHDCKRIFYLFCYVFLCGLCAWTLIVLLKCIEDSPKQPRHYDKLQALININIKISIYSLTYVVLHVYFCGLPLCIKIQIVWMPLRVWRIVLHF